MREPVPKLVFTRQEAAEALSISVRTLDRLTHNGKLKPNRATRRPLYARVELERFLKETSYEEEKTQPA
jgi:excisionase family DNA binding protein